MTGLKVLVADDDADYRAWLVLHLEQAGYVVITAADGVEALSQVEVDRPDLILLDVMMPRMDGFEVLQRLKAEPATAVIPVILLLGIPAEAGEHRAIWEPGEFYVSSDHCSHCYAVIKPLLKEASSLLRVMARLVAGA